MTAPDRLETELPRLLEHLYLGPRPPYADDALRVAAATPRPARWSLAERWRRLRASLAGTIIAPGLPWRAILAAALITMALVAGTVIVGGRQQVLPTPISTEHALPPPVATEPPASVTAEPTPAPQPSVTLAANGRIAYIWRGDIYVGNPATGTTTAIITGPGKLADPQYSPDGTEIAFLRSDPTHQTGVGADIVVALADGSDERVVLPSYAAEGPLHFAWTPDSASLVVTHGSVERPSSAPTRPYDQALSIIDVSGAREPRLLTPPLPRWPARQWMDPTEALTRMFRPPEGDRIVVGDLESLEVFDAELVSVAQLGRTAVEGPEPYWIRWPAWSPDGSMILFSLDRGEFGWFDSVVGSFVMNADGTGVRRIGPSGLVPKSAWSPDSTKIAFERWTIDPDRPEAVIFIVDVASGAERVLGATSVNPSGAGPIPQGWSWSPDGRSIIFVEREGAHPIVVDIDTGLTTELPWDVESAPSWQRIPLD